MRKCENPPESNAEKLAYSAEASRISMERSFMKIFPSLQTKKSALPVSGEADALMLKQFCRAYVRHSGKMAAGTFAWAKVRKNGKW